LTAEAAIAVFHVAFGHWVEKANDAEFAELIRRTRDELQHVTWTAGRGGIAALQTG
jgi:hypothetical protein